MALYLKDKKCPGFTLVELLIVLGIVAIIALVSMPFSGIFFGQNELQQTMFELIDGLRQAQARAMTGMGGEPWGVHLESGSFAVFKGAAYSAADTDNEVNDLPGIVTIQNISLNGGGDDIIFMRVLGNTSTYGSLTLEDENSDSRASITINQEGLINYNLDL